MRPMQINITYLEVPFNEKDEAKALGAWWDPEVKKWFVPRGKTPETFARWLPSDTQSEIPSRAGDDVQKAKKSYG